MVVFMRRFFFDGDNFQENRCLLPEEESRHISKVLRLPEGSQIELFDGSGAVYTAIIQTLGRHVEVKLLEKRLETSDTAKVLSVGQALLKGDKMDTLVQQCTELGAAHFMPFHSARCQGKLEQGQYQKKFERWQRIGLAACKQCSRPTPMEIHVPVSLPQVLANNKADLGILFWEEERENHLKQIQSLGDAHSVFILLGPEGGLSKMEVEQARGFGWQTVSLGKRILRAETATITAVSIVQHLLGNL
jgi:16S rRNA (uracil1498-N3)-methyltransferase